MPNLLDPAVGTTISTEYQQGDNTPSVSGRQLSTQLIGQQQAAQERLTYIQILTPRVGPQYIVSGALTGVRGSFPDGRILAYSDVTFGYDCRSGDLNWILLWTDSAPVKS